MTEDAAVVLEGKEWFLAAYAPQGIPSSDHLQIRNIRLSLAPDSFPDGNVAVRIQWISVEPYVRSLITGLEDGLGLFLPQLKLGQAVASFGIGRVIQSKNENFVEGDTVIHPFFPVAEYWTGPSDFMRKLNLSEGIELPVYINSLGLPGFSAWVGMGLLGKPREGENVFVSAAAGGVGICAGQIAKAKGSHVIGSTGSDEKVKLLREELGYDDAFNYKKTDMDAALSAHFPDGIDLYFDNVGGKTLEAVLNHVNSRARIILCGMISQYNQMWRERDGVRNLLNLVGKEVTMQGFMVGNYMHLFGEFVKEMEESVKEGRIKSKHQVYHGIDSFLGSLLSLFSSSNVGKVVIQIHP